MADFAMEIHDLPGIPRGGLAEIQGSIDYYTAGSFREEMEASRSQGIRLFVLNLEKVTYINSSGLSTIINLAGAGTAKAPTLVLLRVPPKIKVLFDVMKLEELFHYCQTLDEAVEILKKTGEAQSPAA